VVNVILGVTILFHEKRICNMLIIS
jgi:hypothetical protein